MVELAHDNQSNSQPQNCFLSEKFEKTVFRCFLSKKFDYIPIYHIIPIIFTLTTHVYALILKEVIGGALLPEVPKMIIPASIIKAESLRAIGASRAAESHVEQSNHQGFEQQGTRFWSDSGPLERNRAPTVECSFEWALLLSS